MKTSTGFGHLNYIFVFISDMFKINAIIIDANYSNQVRLVTAALVMYILLYRIVRVNLQDHHPT